MANEIDIIRDELAKTSDQAISAIGEYVTNVLLSHPEQGEHVEKGKTLKGAYEAMRNYARGLVKGSGAAYVGPAQASRIINEYYGFTAGDARLFLEPASQTAPAAPVAPVAPPNPQTSADSAKTGEDHPAALDVGLDLDELLAGL